MNSDAACGLIVGSDQGLPDWVAVKRAGVSFVFLRATTAQHWTDPLFGANWRELADRGLLRGATHIFRPGVDAFAQAEHFCQTVRLRAGDLPPVLQVAEPGHSPESLAEEVTDWLTTVERETGRTPIIHTHPDVWDAISTPNFGRYGLWVADYGVSAPRLPQGWRHWDFWQLLQASRRAGLPTHVDLSVFNGSFAELCRLTGALSSTDSTSQSDRIVERLVPRAAANLLSN